jgi:uncharacterized protein YecE (DUF72 family)
MDFGRAPILDNIDFTFPPEHAGNVNILPGFPAAEAHVHIGCPIWSEKSWVGKIYPKGTKEKDYLKYYAEKYSCIELNATHYNVPDKETIQRWCSLVPEHFKFCPKVPQHISHSKDLVKTTDLMLEFISAMNLMGGNLGTTFLQLPPQFKPDKIKQLIYFLNAMPDGFSLSIEFRHEEWFKDKLKWDKIFNYLEDRRMGIVISDVAGRRDVLHQRLSNRVAFIRFAANDLHQTDFQRLENWSSQLKKWLTEGLTDLYFIIHTPNSALSPELTDYFSRKLLPKPPKDRIDPDFQQGSLF